LVCYQKILPKPALKRNPAARKKKNKFIMETILFYILIIALPLAMLSKKEK
jgi:hypothetical protein